MTRLRYNVAVSLDGFIAPPDGSSSWIVQDPSINFQALYAEFDAFIMGRKTYQVLCSMGEYNPLKGRPKNAVVVVSRTLKPDENNEVTILKEGHLEHVKGMKKAFKKDIWVLGGGWLASECLDAGLLDVVETAIMPVLLRGGVKLFTGC